MMQVEKIWEFLQRLSPLTRSCLLTELERLDVCGVDMPGSADIQAKLREEFRRDSSGQARMNGPARYFFAPLDPYLVNGAPEHANSGRISRGSLLPIWEWISRDLLPTMARDYIAQMKGLIAADKQREARQVATAFQIKIAKHLANTLRSPDSANQTRSKLATYTASPSAFADLGKIICVLRTREMLAKFDEALPQKIAKLDDAQADKISVLLETFENNDDALPFALTLVANRLKTPWNLIYLATKSAPSRNAADIAGTRYAVAVPMVMDLIDDKRLALRSALKNNQVLIAREILVQIYDIEHALRTHIELLDQTEWGAMLCRLMDAIAALVDAEVNRFPEKVGHILNSRRLRRRHQSATERLTDAITTGAAFCMRLIKAA
jgi:hypothetical protein